MAEMSGEIQVYNPDKQISEQVTLKNIVNHSVAMRLARTGIPELPSEKPLSFNQKTRLRVKGINEVISGQQCIVTDAKAIVKKNCEVKWKKKNKKEDEQKENPFEDEDNDYNELVAIMIFLDICERKVLLARKNRNRNDAFIVERQDSVGETSLELTNNFFSMIKELEDSYEAIYGIMLVNKIVSSGISVDEEMDEKAKEKELIRRVLNA